VIKITSLVYIILSYKDNNYYKGCQMKKSTMIQIATGLATLLLVTTTAHAEDSKPYSKHKFFGFSQIGLQAGDGAKKSKDADFKMDADRIRLGWKYFSGPLAGKVFLDFSKSGDSGAGMPDMIKDAFISYKMSSAAVVKAGMIKTPVGMGFTIPGWNLDVIKRGFDKKLAFERASGLMLSGRAIGGSGKVNGLEMGHERPWTGFGYDIMVAGQTGRSGAVKNAKAGDDNAYMGRVMYDQGQILHVEASYGVSKHAGGINADNYVDNKIGKENYKLLNVGIDSHFERANVKAEYYDAQSIRGVDGWDMNTLALTGTYYVTDTVELAVKDIRGTESLAGTDRDAANTYLGVNYYINPKNNKMDRKNRRARNQHRIQLNYVVADVDDGFKGVGALYKDNAILAQYQFKF
jgi:hypothetical protein